MDVFLYLFPFLSAFALTVACILLFLSIPFFRQAFFRRKSRQQPPRHLSRLGGVAMLFGFSATILLNQDLIFTPGLVGMFFGIGCIFLFGMWDDILPLDWKTQVFFQISLGIIVFLFGVRVLSLTHPLGGVWDLTQGNLPLVGFLLLLMWLILVVNSMNWLDGLDGLCGGVALLTLATIFLLSLKPEVNQPPIALIAVTGMGTVLAFLVFNVYPAKIVAGTVGSVFLGFLVAILAVIAGTKIATALLVLALPIADAFYVLIRRLRDRAPLFQADDRHLHYRLLQLGWSEGQIVLFFFSVTTLVSALALVTQALGKFVAILLTLGIIFLILFFVEYLVRRKRRLL